MKACLLGKDKTYIVSLNTPWILLTNDDGADSPALLPLMASLARIAPVRALVPAEERSWAAKKMSRFGRLRLRRGAAVEDGEIWLLEGGYPADCANLGVYRLCQTPPALVVSGVNVGANVGLAYFLSSGTVGAAMEGYLAGVPAVALSLQLEAEVYRRWRRTRSLDGMEARWAAAAEVSRQVAAEVMQGGLPRGAALLSVNMPPQVEADTPRRFAGLTPSAYGSFFAAEPGSSPETERVYSYRLDGLQIGRSDGLGDIETLERGEVALTPIRLTLDCAPDDEDRRRFERP